MAYISIELERRAETSRPKWNFYIKAKILRQSRKPVGRKYHKAKKYYIYSLLLDKILHLFCNYLLTAYYNQPNIGL